MSVLNQGAADELATAVTPDAPVADGLTEELRTVVALRSRTALRDRHLPLLAALLPADAQASRDHRLVALQELTDAAVARIDDEAHRRAATALLGLGPLRWRPLGQRGAEAAAAFGCGWDAYRRRRPTTGASLLEETLVLVAAGLRTVADEDVVAAPTPTPVPTIGPATDPVATATAAVIEQPAPATVTRPDADRLSTVRTVEPMVHRSRRTVVVLVGIVVVVAVAAATGAWALGRRDGAEQPAACRLLIHRVGETATEAAPDLVRWADAFREAGEELPEMSRGCASFIEADGNQVIQRVAYPGSGGIGAIVASDDGRTAVALNAFEFTEFRNHQLEQDVPSGRLGTPVERQERPDGTRVVTFTDGTIVQPDPQLPATAVVQRYWQEWLALGGFDGEPGAPVSPWYGSPDGTERQEFEGGDLVASLADGLLRWEPIDAEDRTLPDDPRNRILTTAAGQVSWLVDQDGVRHWIPSQADYACAERSLRADPLLDVRAAAVATLELGEPFRCR